MIATPSIVPPRSLRQAWPALTGLSAVFLFEMLDNSVLTIALPTIGADLRASTAALQWVVGGYAIAFGALMLVFGAAADRFGRRRLMLVGLALLAAASLATALVSTAEQLIAVRVLTGVAAAMTTPGSMALAFRLFDEDALRLRAITLISTVGLVGLAIGPPLGGLVIQIAPWQVLLVVNVPIAVLAIIGVRRGVAADRTADLHRDPLDIPGAALGTASIALALVAPTLFVDRGAGSWWPWASGAAALAALGLFVLRERSTRYPLISPELLARPLVSSGLAFKAAAGLAVAGLGYLVTLQLQLDWGWPPALAALGMLPQVVVLIAGSAFVNPLVGRLGPQRAAWISAGAVVAGLACFGLLGSHGYPWVAVSLALVAAGMRVIGVVAALTVVRGLPADRTTIGTALSDTASQVASGIGITVTGTILAALFTGSLAGTNWTAQQTDQFGAAVTAAGLALTVLAGALVAFGIHRGRRA
ncbi:MFS transporter [Mycobacterium sp. MBM]|nr:MFS transporter [Mycobacterium sp. MBM]